MLTGALSGVRNSFELGSGCCSVVATYAVVESWRDASFVVSGVSWFFNNVSTCSAVAISLHFLGGVRYLTYVVEPPAASRSPASAHSSCAPHRMRNRERGACKCRSSVLSRRIVVSSSDTTHRRCASVCSMRRSAHRPWAIYYHYRRSAGPGH